MNDFSCYNTFFIRQQAYHAFQVPDGKTLKNVGLQRGQKVRNFICIPKRYIEHSSDIYKQSFFVIVRDLFAYTFRIYFSQFVQKIYWEVHDSHFFGFLPTKQTTHLSFSSFFLQKRLLNVYYLLWNIIPTGFFYGRFDKIESIFKQFIIFPISNENFKCKNPDFI